MKKAILILIVFASAFVAAWLLLKPIETVIPVQPLQSEDETEVYRLAPEGDAVYEGSKISSVPTNTTTSTTTSTTVSSSGRRSTGLGFSFWNEQTVTPFK